MPPGFADTIFALATASGRSGVAVIRLSGPRTRAALDVLEAAPRQARRMERARFRDPATREILDDGLAVFFPGPASFTGEDVGELHLHGSAAVIAGVLDALGRIAGLRLAEPGEFTRRAFHHGKLDLTEVEGLADLVAAETASQRRQALRQLGGALGRIYEGWRQDLLRTLAHLEATIDFPEDDLPSGLEQSVRGTIDRLTAEIRVHLADDRRGERLRDGVSVAIVGPPNVGKSSLLNALARREAAIVSSIAGTTRDVIELHLDLGGYPVILADTAGLRETADIIELEGVRRARIRGETADLRLVVVEAGEGEAQLAALAEIGGTDAMIVANKADLSRASVPAGAVPVSVITGEGMAELLVRLTAEVAARLGQDGAPVITRARHRAALSDCAEALERARLGPSPELVAEDLRLAARALGRITGRVDVEDLLDLIFREFCIGK